MGKKKLEGKAKWLVFLFGKEKGKKELKIIEKESKNLIICI